jgi:hypothetical protein
MDAEIYYLSGQEYLLPALQDSLRRRVYSGMTFIPRRIEMSGYSSVFAEVARQYVKLLQASVPPAEGLNFHVNEMEHYGYRFYIEVYYTIYNYYQKFVPSPDCFFPAVAIRERMALVPTSLRERLASSLEAITPFKPFEAGGLIEVDFADELGLDEAVARIGERIQKDLLEEVRAYATYQNYEGLSIGRISTDLSVDPGLVRQVLEVEAVEARGLQSVACHIDREDLPLGVWTKVQLTVDNPLDTPLTDLIVEVSGPVEILPSPIRISIPARQSAGVRVSIKPTNMGEFPLELVLTRSGDRVLADLLADLLPVHHVWLAVHPQ